MSEDKYKKKQKSKKTEIENANKLDKRYDFNNKLDKLSRSDYLFMLNIQ